MAHAIVTGIGTYGEAALAARGEAEVLGAAAKGAAGGSLAAAAVCRRRGMSQAGCTSRPWLAGHWLYRSPMG